MYLLQEDTLIYDIETITTGKPNPQTDKLRLFGCYSYKTSKYYFLTNKNEIQKVINLHKYLVGFSNKHYDNPILIREGIDFKFKFIIDLQEIIDKRSAIIKIKEGLLSDLLVEKTLKFITNLLGLVNETTGKMDIDYKLFNKKEWTEEEKKLVIQYTQRDLEITKKLYEWLEAFFTPFKYFLLDKDNYSKKYLTDSPATFAYKALCKEMGWEVEYSEDDEEERKEIIGGGYVSYPAGERFEGVIRLMDFASLYPHIMMQCNLHGREKENQLTNRSIWNGGLVWKVDGNYYSDELSNVGKVIQKWFKQRQEYKKIKDRREYAIKILLNIIYGTMDNPKYTKVYDKIGAGDCTRIGRQWIKYVRKIFRNKGYKICYSDTDSIYLLDHLNDINKIIEIKNEAIAYLKTTVPFPQDTFDLVLEDELKYLFFFKGKEKQEDDEDYDEDDFINKPLNLLKKNYIYVTKDDRLIVKNLGVRKKSTSLLTRKIFFDYMVLEIIKNGSCKFRKVWIKNLILELLQKDIKLASIRYDVGDIKEYINSPNSIYAQISNRYGSGIHFMMPNLKNIGVGKGKSYCTIEEFNQHKLKIGDIDLENVYKELDYFTKPIVTKNIFDFV